MNIIIIEGAFMAKAKISTKGGTEITIIGTSEEVADIIENVRRRESYTEWRREQLRKHGKLKEKSSRVTATDSILKLREEGFFDNPRELQEIKKALEEQGYVYPITTLSPLLLKIVQRRNLGRIKKEKVWCYVKR